MYQLYTPIDTLRTLERPIQRKNAFILVYSSVLIHCVPYADIKRYACVIQYAFQKDMRGYRNRIHLWHTDDRHDKPAPRDCLNR